MTNAILRGRPDAGNPHVRFDEGEVAPAKPRRGSLLYILVRAIGGATLCASILLVGPALGQTKNVLTTVGTTVWNQDSVSSSANLALAAGNPCSFTAFFKIDPAKLWNNADIKYAAKIVGVGSTMLGVHVNGDATNMVFKDHSGQYTWNTITLCPAPLDGAWHHAALTIAGANSLVFYLDGEVVYTGTANIGSSENAPVTLMVNRGSYGSQSGGFGGSLAEVSIWNRVLSQAEVLELKAGRPDSTALNNGCIGFWPLEGEPGETTAADLLGGHDLTIVRSPAYIDFTTANDFPAYLVGDSKIYVPVNRLYPTNLVDVTIGAGASVKDDLFEKDTLVTLVATAKDPSVKFVRWYGDVSEAVASNSTIEILADQEKTLLPYFEFKWTFDETAKTISDGYWTIAATLNNDNEITTAKPKGHLPLPLLDFAKGIETADGNACALVTIGGSDVTGGAFEGVSGLEELRLPDTLRTVTAGLDVNWSHGAFKNCLTLKKVSPFMPDSLQILHAQMFFGCSSLTGELVLGGGENELDVRETTESASWKTSIYGQQFYGTKITGVNVRKTVRSLPYSVFFGCSALTNVVFEKGSVTNVSGNAFYGCTGVKTFVMPERPAGIDSSAFGNWANYQCRFVIKASDPGWSSYMAGGAETTNFTAWADLDPAVQQSYGSKFPGERRPLGLSLTLPANQWLCESGSVGMKILLK